MKPNQENATPIPSKNKTTNQAEKKSKPNVPVIVLSIITLLGISFGIYGLFFKSEKSCPYHECLIEKPEKSEERLEESKEKPNNTENPEQAEPIIPTLPISFDNVVNSKHGEYHNEYGTTAVAIRIDVIDQNSKKNENYSYINCSADLCKVFDSTGEESATINNFQGKIREFYYAHFGQQYGDETLYFVMEDGSVEYIPVHEAFNNNDIRSYGKIDGLAKIIKIHKSSGASYSNEDNAFRGGWLTALAEDTDGNFYDLYHLEPFSETSL